MIFLAHTIGFDWGSAFTCFGVLFAGAGLIFNAYNTYCQHIRRRKILYAHFASHDDTVEVTFYNAGDVSIVIQRIGVLEGPKLKRLGRSERKKIYRDKIGIVTQSWAMPTVTFLTDAMSQSGAYSQIHKLIKPREHYILRFKLTAADLRFDKAKAKETKQPDGSSRYTVDLQLVADLSIIGGDSFACIKPLGQFTLLEDGRQASQHYYEGAGLITNKSVIYKYLDAVDIRLMSFGGWVEKVMNPPDDPNLPRI